MSCFVKTSIDTQMSFLAKFGDSYRMFVSVLMIIGGAILALVVQNWLWGIIILILGLVLFIFSSKKFEGLGGK